MKRMTLILIIVFFSPCNSANSISLEATDCKLLSGADKIQVNLGTLFSSVCVRKDNEFSCLHIDNHGEPINTEDKYIIFYDDGITIGFWNSPKGNIIMHVDYIKNKFQMGMTIFSDKGMVVVNKLCVGIIKKSPQAIK